MSLKQRTARGFVVLVGGEIAGKGLSFGRNVIVTRFLAPADYGIAATFLITMRLLQMMADVGVEKLVVQSPDGEDRDFQATVQFLGVFRGLLIGAILFLLSWPVSAMFDVPQARWAFQVLAIGPVIMGFAHLDLLRAQRGLSYSPSVINEVVPQLCVTIVAWPLASWLRDYSVILWLQLAMTAMQVAGSHIMAKRRYAWAMRRDVVRDILRFGWPLLVNGLLLFGVQQGDRIAVGAAFSMEDLGVYSIAAALTAMPAMVMIKIGSSLFLPSLSELQSDAEGFARRLGFCSQIMAVLAAAVTIPLVILGARIIPVIYGEEYAGGALVVGWLAATHGARIFRVAPTVASLAKADTISVMLANTARSLALLGVLTVATLQWGMQWIAGVGCVGEILALGALSYRLRVREAVPLSVTLSPAIWVSLSVLGSGWAAHAIGAADADWLPLIALATVCTATGVGLLLGAYPRVREALLTLSQEGLARSRAYLARGAA